MIEPEGALHLVLGAAAALIAFSSFLKVAWAVADALNLSGDGTSAYQPVNTMNMPQIWEKEGRARTSK